MKKFDDSVMRDRLSNLPDTLLHRILPHFRAREAVQTCIWSKKWKNFWVSLPCLIIDMREFQTDATKKMKFNKTYYTKFVNFVNNLLERRDNQAYLENFQIWCKDLEEQYNPSVINWILYAINHNPKVIKIDAYECSFLPQRIFTCESLEELSLSIISSWKQIKELLPDTINLPNLKKLHLLGQNYNSDCENHEDSSQDYADCVIINEILSFTPSLDELSIESLPLAEIISSKTLKNLKIKSCHGWWGLWELNTPKLVSFYCTGNIVTLGDTICGSKMMDLKNANISLEDDGSCGILESRVTFMLNNFWNVETLELSLKLGSHWWQMELQHYCAKFENLKTLSLREFSAERAFRIAAGILQHSPNLEKLILWHNSEHYLCFYNKKGGVKGSLWAVALSRCEKLKIIEIKYSTFNDVVKQDLDSLREAIKKHKKV
ncbi:hypothetical protein LUZ60_012600 [Juncus effusus]|nr:hypothetical protein LUZ60_012600 [Juncus effusus]